MAFLKIGDEVPTKGRGSKLTRMQMQFIEAMTDPAGKGYHSPTNAVRLTDYKTDNPNKMGMQLMQHPLVAAELKERFQARRERMELTADYVLHKLIDIVEQTEKDSDRIRAVELLGKNLGLFKERTEISGPDGAAIEYEQKIKNDAADFASRIASLAKRSGEKRVSEVTESSSTG